MEDESPKKRNVRPVEKSNLPVITLFVLVLLVLSMLYVGYEYISDSSSNADELIAGSVDTSTLEPGIAEPVTEEPANAGRPEVFKPKKTEKETKPADEKKSETPTETAKPIAASSVGGQSITHSVKKGDTFTNIAARYNLKTETVKGLNSSVSEIKAGTTKLNIQVKAIHTVGPGDVLRVVATKYGVSKEAIMKANGKTKDFAQRGEKLIIPFPDKK